MALNRIFPQSKKTLTLPVTTGLLSGAPEVVGKIPCVLLTDADDDDNATVQLDAVFELSVHAEGGAIAVGDKLYYDSADHNLNDDSAHNPFFGYALEAVASGTATKRVQVGA